MWALGVLMGSLVIWSAGIMAAFKLWSPAWGLLISIGLTVLFWQQILMAIVLVFATIAMSMGRP